MIRFVENNGLEYFKVINDDIGKPNTQKNPESIKENYTKLEISILDETKSSNSHGSNSVNNNFVLDSVSNIFNNNRTNSVSLDDSIAHFQSNDIIGEDKNACLMTLCTIQGLSFGLVGLSGSGKTYQMDAFLELIPGKYIEMGLSSDLAVMNNSTEINKKSLLYFPEIQKSMNKKNSTIVEVFKDLTEGKNSKRMVTKKQGEVLNYEINSKPIMFTLAKENGFKPDDETARRFIELETNLSKDHIENVLRYKAEKRMLGVESKYDINKTNSLKQHIHDCMSNSFDYKDPFAVYMNNHFPQTPKTIGFINHYYGLLNASANFHNQDRISSGDNIFLNIEDHFIVHSLYHSDFCDTLSKLNKSSEYSDVIDNAKQEVNWSKCFESAYQVMTRNFPDVADVWKDSQIERNDVNVYNPLTRKKEVLLNPIKMICDARVEKNETRDYNRGH